MNTQLQYQCKVLIVGMGPSGMLLANEMQKHQIDYLIIDKRKAVSDITRAVNVTPATLAVLNFSLGLNFTEKTKQTDSIEAYWKGKPISRISYRYQKFPYRKFCYLPQPILEQELYQPLFSQRKKIFEETELTEIKKIDKSYLVKLYSKNKDEIMVKCDYLIGCDGNNSVIRNWANISSEEENYNSSFLLYDIETDDKLIQDSSYYLFEGGYVIIVPIAAKRYRIIISSDEITDTDRSTYNNLASIKLFLKKYCQLTVNINQIIWFTHSEFRHRISQSASEGNCFLVGDALHIFSPVGGLNLSTGLQDAINLGWKLAYVIKGNADKALLDSYTIERIQAIQIIKEKTRHLTKVMTQAERYPSSLQYISSFRNKHQLKHTLPSMMSGYDGYGEAVEQEYIGFKPGRHISEFISDQSTYSNLCQRVHSKKFNLISSNDHILSKFNCDYLNAVFMPELKLNNQLILLRPDGYIYGVIEKSGIDNLLNQLKYYLGDHNA